MMLRRFVEAERRYVAHEVPDSWRVSAHETDMSTLVNCCRCGRELPYGECYTSLQVHTRMGFGYAVCHDCYYGTEWPERDAARGGRVMA